MNQIVLFFHGLISGRERVLAYAVAILVVAICWVVIIASGDRIKSFDEGAFQVLADNLVTTGRYSDHNDIITAFRAPGLVFFLAPFAGLGLDIVGLRLVNAVLIGLSLILVYHFLARKAGPLAGLFSVILIPLWPVVIYAGTTLYPQTLAAFLLVLLVILLDRLTGSDRLMPAVWSGLCYGALLLTLPIVLLLWPVFVLYILWQSRAKLAHVAIFTAIGFGLMGAWTYRNYVQFDHFIPVATSSGYNLLAGNGPNARYDTSLEVRFPEYVYTELTGKSEAEANDIMTAAAIKAITDDPGRAASLYVGKFLHWFDYSNSLLSDRQLDGGASSIAVSKRDLILLVTYAAIIMPLLLHLVFMRSYPFKRIEILFIALWVTAGLAYAIFFTRVRFRLPFDWLVISSNAIFLAAVLETYIARIRSKGDRS